MKKIALVLITLFAIVTIVAASNNEPNKVECRIINYQFDYTDMIIDKMEAKGFIAMHENEENDTPDVAFEKFTQKLEMYFVSVINAGSLRKNNIRLDNEAESQYQLIIRFLKVDKDGEHKVECSLWDRKQNQCIETISTHGGGGMWGSFMNLFTDSMSKSGKKMGNKICGIIKKLPTK